MSYELVADERRRLIMLIPHGKITISEMWKAREDVAERLKGLGYNRVLLDMRDYSMDMAVIERYECWTTLSRSFPLAAKIALVTDPGHPEHETHKFMETSLYNHSFTAMLFTSKKNALAWFDGKAGALAGPGQGSFKKIDSV